MKRRTILLVALLLVTSLLAGCIGGGKKYDLTVTVVDKANEPLENVTISINGDPKGETDANGKFTITDLKKNVTVTASLEGYSTVTRDLDLSKDNQVTITLAKEATDERAIEANEAIQEISRPFTFMDDQKILAAEEKVKAAVDAGLEDQIVDLDFFNTALKHVKYVYENNIVNDAGFDEEIPTYEGGWAIWQGPFMPRVTDVVRYEGRTSLQLQNTVDKGIANKGFHQIVELVEGKTYILGAWVRVEEIGLNIDMVGSGVSGGIHFRDSIGEWQFGSLEFTVESYEGDFEDRKIQGFAFNEWSAYVDYVFLVEKPEWWGQF